MAPSPSPSPAPSPSPRLRHWAGFLAAGAISFLIDAGVLEGLVRIAGLDALVARVPAIAAAIAGGWLAHRRLTFAMATPATLGEGLRYAGSALASSAVNYALFALLLLTLPGLGRIPSLFLSSLAAAAVAYLGMRHLVFDRRER